MTIMPPKKINLVLAGSPQLAIPAFEALWQDNRYSIAGVLTPQDKPAGRGRKMTPPPVKLWAQSHNLLVWQPEPLLSWLATAQEIQPEMIVVMAYGQFVPPVLLNIPRLGWVNVHGSLLPKYRGAGILTAPIINGDRETGISLIQLTKKLDAGPVIARRVIPLSPTETNESLATKIANEAALMLPDTLYQYAQGLLVPKEQDDSQATYVGLVRPQDARIDWRKSAQEIERLIRAMQPKPGAWTMWDGQRLKIIASQVADSAGFKPGRVEYVNNQLLVGTGQGNLIVNKLQLAGRSVLGGAEFLRGHPTIIGAYLY
ncbi:MAG TPA: methionyl-tRNA formyltransferase [bacterium]|jgi:methionyl-tRNA formyltransferase|nr:methionyl-tRNA formyltransferase [bacterium]HNU90013.1 methionyl-tRNA formyltransferase [bacterium]HOS99191.1 methionyl-tRNA formyltransferase [bacterium]HPD03432.1 methionyl-tRNA formyltransferase [bacterium]HPL83543.1 methionyl-tRNA formyltransferase [bacterium]